MVQICPAVNQRDASTVMQAPVRILMENGIRLHPPKILRPQARTAGLSVSRPRHAYNRGDWLNREAYARLQFLSSRMVMPARPSR